MFGTKKYLIISLLLISNVIFAQKVFNSLRVGYAHNFIGRGSNFNIENGIVSKPSFYLTAARNLIGTKYEMELSYVNQNFSRKERTIDFYNSTTHFSTMQLGVNRNFVSKGKIDFFAGLSSQLILKSRIKSYDSTLEKEVFSNLNSKFYSIIEYGKPNIFTLNAQLGTKFKIKKFDLIVRSQLPLSSIGKIGKISSSKIYLHSIMWGLGYNF